LLLLIAVFLQPYGDSRASDQWVTLHPGIPVTSLPYIIVIGLPVLGIAVGGVVDATRGSLFARIILWLSTAIVGIEAVPAILNIAILLILIPMLVLGLCASAFAIDGARTSQRAHMAAR
jgi:cation transporter-like permease